MGGQILIDLDTRKADWPIIPACHSPPFHWTWGRGIFSVRRWSVWECFSFLHCWTKDLMDLFIRTSVD